MNENSERDDRADGLMDFLLHRYGERITTQQQGEVREAVQAIVAASEAMRAVPLDNGDIPFVVPPYRSDEQNDA